MGPDEEELAHGASEPARTVWCAVGQSVPGLDVHPLGTKNQADLVTTPYSCLRLRQDAAPGADIEGNIVAGALDDTTFEHVRLADEVRHVASRRPVVDLLRSPYLDE